MSGKSSLTVALVHAGADYYSDEYAVLDNLGLIRPYTREPVKPQLGAPTRRVPFQELGCRSGPGPAKIKMIALLRFDPWAGWQPEALARGPALLRLLDNSVAARSRPRAVLSALEGATLHAHAFEGARGVADETAAQLMSMLS